MTANKPDIAEDSSRPARPRALQTGLVLVFVAAAVNVAIGVLVAQQATTTRLPVQPGLVAAVVAIAVVYSGALVTLGLLLQRGRSWAQGALLVASALSLLTLFAPNALNLAVIVLLVIAAWFLHRREVRTWLRGT